MKRTLKPAYQAECCKCYVILSVMYRSNRWYLLHCKSWPMKKKQFNGSHGSHNENNEWLSWTRFLLHSTQIIVQKMVKCMFRVLIKNLEQEFYTISVYVYTVFDLSLCLEMFTISGADMVYSPQGPHLYCRHGAMKKWNKWVKWPERRNCTDTSLKHTHILNRVLTPHQNTHIPVLYQFSNWRQLHLTTNWNMYNWKKLHIKIQDYWCNQM